MEETCGPAFSGIGKVIKQDPQDVNNVPRGIPKRWSGASTAPSKLYNVVLVKGSAIGLCEALSREVERLKHQLYHVRPP